VDHYRGVRVFRGILKNTSLPSHPGRREILSVEFRFHLGTKYENREEKKQDLPKKKVTDTGKMILKRVMYKLS
jgi:hypothetical protein